MRAELQKVTKATARGEQVCELAARPNDHSKTITTQQDSSSQQEKQDNGQSSFSATRS
jgi:hypothetical protein